MKRVSNIHLQRYRRKNRIPTPITFPPKLHPLSDITNPRIHMIWKHPKGKFEGELVFELFNKVVPKTADNFRSLSTGECGMGSHGKLLNYKSSTMNKVVPGYFIQGGDITGKGDSLGYSIYGESFPDENFDIPFDRAGLLAMANNGPNTNSSQFFVTLAPLPWLNGKNVVFGRLVRGMSFLRKLQFKSRPSVLGVPLHTIMIENSWQHVLKDKVIEHAQIQRAAAQKKKEEEEEEKNE